MDVQYEVVIIGAGPAGMTAAVYASRAGLKTVMLERGAPGGKMVETYEIENYPGFKSIIGSDLAMAMYEQSIKFGAKYQYGDVKDIQDKGDYKVVVLADGTEITTEKVIIATGTVERKLGVPGEKEYAGKGVSYCAVCDGAFFKDQIVTVIGGGNSALGGALYLTKFAKQVNVVIRRDVFRATESVQEDLNKNEKINVITKSIPVEVLGEDGKVCGIVLENVDTKEHTTIETQGIFPYIGADPITDFANSLNLEQDHGYIVTDENMETSCKGVYAIGDVRKKDLRQVVTATNDGAIAAEAINQNK